MTEITRPWDGTSIGDAGPYSAQEWQAVWQALWHGSRANEGVIIDSGAVANVGLQVQATSPATTSIEVLSGAALVRGIAYLSDDTETFPIAANASGNPRIDTVILRADYPAQTVRLAVLQGTAAASPTPPTLTQSAGILWEIPIADIAVANGFVTITDANITSRAEWANAADGVYLLDVLNNSGAALEDGTVVIWDSTTDRAVTTTTTVQADGLAGVWLGRTANGGYGRVQVQGIGFVRTTAAVTRGQRLDTSSTAGAALGASYGRIGTVIETTSGAGLVLTHINVDTKNVLKRAVLEDQKAQNTAGGGSTATTWTTRVLNTEVSDPLNIVTIASNQFTPVAGIYTCDIASTFRGGASAGAVLIRLFNITTNTEIDASLSNTLAAGIYLVSRLTTVRFTANGTDAYAVQYWVDIARATDGLGSAVNLTGRVERYTRVVLEKWNQ